MAELVQALSAQGPLPIKQTATIETDAPTVVTLAGSVWAADQDYMIGVVLFIDGQQVEVGQIFANAMSTHLAFVPVTFSYTFADTPSQEHVFELGKLTGETMADENDHFLITVQY